MPATKSHKHSILQLLHGALKLLARSGGRLMGIPGSGIHALFAIPKYNCTTWVVQYHVIHKYKLNNHGGYTDHYSGLSC